MTNRPFRAATAHIASILAACTLAGIASAQPATPVSRAEAQTTITLDSIPTMHVTSLGRVTWNQPPSYGPRACNILSSHTDANFEGGSYTMQAGFAETEAFAATYTIPAADFPIKIDLIEAIFATSGASTSTTTEWSVMFWSGTPTNGTLVATYSSDGIVLPHIELPAGTNGINVQFGIDPTDPEQVIINNNGSNQFTIAYRIDNHNQQTQNPCFTAPPTCCNAFPVTDTSGLSQSGRNWLFGVNCGSIGCPPNGGWSTFANLASFCRPSGDVVMRARWSSLSCTPGVGSCCLPGGACEVRTINDCQTAGGTYRGDGTTCATPCPAPVGACCLNNGTFCLNLTQNDCTGAGGVWSGPGTACNGSACPTGACCLANGSCVAGVSQSACAAQGGTYRGDNTNCSTPCPQPNGACCFSGGFCLSLTSANCSGAGGTWAGPNTTCVDTNGNTIADACESGCGSADFDGDGDTGTDSDIEAFFACLGGNCCQSCGSADFDGDGDVGTDADIEAFFRILGGGNC